ncbi:CoA transferase [Nocardia stercoris]|uniref:Carnitine dehydratase n=1 Tax=Nocardia stercoris TaxID=2483361 RepID=A0A3M2KV97_9NOCA|nr:CoA transferase [Nocardia stercoris]RMI28360.1 carnitine dehydratase [Nocardia stercoris]
MTEHSTTLDETDTDLDHVAALNDLLAPVGLTAEDAGGSVDFSGQDPILPARHRLGACIGIPIMAAAVGAVALHRRRGGPDQDLHLDLRQAVHGITPHAFWHPTISGELPPHPLVADNPFLLAPYRTADGRTVMASGVYPHLAAKWCRFLDVPPDYTKAAAAFATRDAAELEESANAAGLPLCIARTPEEWLAHPQGALLAEQPVIGLRRLGDAPVAEFGSAARPLDGIRVLSFTHAIAGPTVGRTLAEHGADVLCATRPNDYEHDFIYAEANIGSRSAYVDLSTDTGRERADRLLADAHVVVNNHRGDKLENLGLDPDQLAARYPGIVVVSVTCYGSEGPWRNRGGFDMNGSAASGLMTLEGTLEDPQLPVTGMINDFITGYLGAVGALAALNKRATEGGSWHVTVNLTRAAMWYRSLGLVDPARAGTADRHQLRDPEAYDSPSPLGDIHMLAPPVRFSHTPARWPDPPLVPRGSSRPQWRSR